MTADSRRREGNGSRTIVLDGMPASEGIAIGWALVVRWEAPEVPRRTVHTKAVEAERTSFREACDWARERLGELRDHAATELGEVQARIFDPQILMLQDQLIAEGTDRYIRENRLSAAWAFDWRIQELKQLWNRSEHPMVLDRLNDLDDLRVRVLHHLLGLPDPDFSEQSDVVILARNLTPSLTVRLNPARVLGIATEEGTRMSHWAILARSMGIPAAVGVGSLVDRIGSGGRVVVDGRRGRVILHPDDRDIELFERRKVSIQSWREEQASSSYDATVTLDGERIRILANLDLPAEAEAARGNGAEGVGLFRTEFLVVGRTEMPDEEEQYQAYRTVLEAFGDLPTTIRAFDIGGDKFPLFLRMSPEENPFLGWRAMRVLLDRPELFRPQLRALLRASVHGRLQVMLPLVNTLDELAATRRLIAEERRNLEAEGTPAGDFDLGVLIETPAAVMLAPTLARHVDFLSIGTNDLVQYAVAVDRTNARLADRYDPFHPGVVQLLRRVGRVAEAAGLELSVCGEMAASPLGAFLLAGLGVRTLSVSWPALPEARALVRGFRMESARAAAAEAVSAASSAEVMGILERRIGAEVDLTLHAGHWRLIEPTAEERAP